MENVFNWMRHPIKNEAKIDFILDVPHLFKCIRNNIWNKRSDFDGVHVCFLLIIYHILTILIINTLFYFITYSTEKVFWHYYNKLYLFERDNSTRIGWKKNCTWILIHFKRCAFLLQCRYERVRKYFKEYHLNKNSFPTRSATPFLATKATEPIKTAFARTVPTQKMSKDLNEVFDILNGHSSAESIMRISWIIFKFFVSFVCSGLTRKLKPSHRNLFYLFCT